MTNNLIFKDGSVYPLFDNNVANAPSMLGSGWRSFHIAASAQEASAKLAIGVSRREYEMIAAVNEDGSYVWELATEDLNAYVVPGSLSDHMDGTVTIWVRKETELEISEGKVAEQAHDLEIVSLAAAKADLSGDNALILDMPTVHCAPWVVGETYTKGLLRAYEGVKYLIMQDVTAAEHQPPNMPNGAMLAIYKPYQGRYDYEWVYGEYCKAGFTRYENGVLYRAISDPGANIYPPSQVPAVWETV